MRFQLAALAIVLMPSIPRPVGACTPIPSNGGPHELDPAESDDMIDPGVVTAAGSVDAAIVHDQGCGAAEPDGGGCGDTPARIRIFLSATDDRTPAHRLGYMLRIVGGEPPRGLVVPSAPLRAFDGFISLPFANDEVGFEVDLEVTAVDLNGNAGPAKVITIEG